MCAYQICKAYRTLPTLRNLECAEDWIYEALKHADSSDVVFRSHCYLALGDIAYERVKDAGFNWLEATTEIRKGTRQSHKLLQYLSTAISCANNALSLLPEVITESRAEAYLLLGRACRAGTQQQDAIGHYASAISLFNACDNLCNAGVARFEVAGVLLGFSRFSDARGYAASALANFRALEGRESDHYRQTEKLLADVNDFISKI